LKSLLAKLSLSLVAILAALALLEVAIRIYYRIQTPATPPASTSVKPVPLHIVSEAPYLYGLNPEHPDISAQATRDAEAPVPKPKDTVRVLVLGDSLAYGSAVAPQETFANRLEELLRRELGNVDVVNAAVSGYTSYNELQYYLARGHDFGADVVLLAFCMNDVVNPRLHWGDAPGVNIPDAAIPNLEYDANHIVPLLRRMNEARPSESRGWRGTFRYSALYRELEPRIQRLLEDKPPAQRNTPVAPTYLTAEDTISIEVLLNESAPEWRWLTAILGRLQTAVESDNATLVMTVFPLAYQMDEGYPFFPQEHLAAYCARTSLPCIDPLPDFRQHGKDQVFRLYQSGYYDVWHLTKLGHEVAAESILKSFKRDKTIWERLTRKGSVNQKKS
jgi:lysophospholipase L1-like esterase